MPRLIRAAFIRLLLLILIASGVLYLPGRPFAAADRDVDEVSPVDVGRQLYRYGLMADGAPVRAIVLGDVEVEGPQFYCMNCHRRSGLGGQEGTTYVLPINGPSLLSPRNDLYMPRPAYTYQSFADAIAAGVNPAGNVLDQAMPRYDLPEREMTGLFAYLKTLSATYSAGVDDQDLHIATVIGADVDPARKEALLGVIAAFIRDKNAGTRHEAKRRENGPFFRDYTNKAYRNWVHHVWQLTGPPETWDGQLEKYYRKQPVFALLSGMVSGPWQPIQDFCDRHELPGILPSTDRPGSPGTNDYHTLYFSRGVDLEARVLAGELTSTNVPGVLQLIDSEGDGIAAAESLAGDIAGKGIAVKNHVFESPEDISEVARMMAQTEAPRVVVLWLGEKTLRQYADRLQAMLDDRTTYFSASLLDGKVDLVPLTPRGNLYAVSPFVPIDAREGRFRLVSIWLKQKKLPFSSWRIQGEAQFACMLLSGGMNHIKTYFYRDYLLDSIEHNDRMGVYSVNYDHMSFGPNQRYLVKGAYVVDLRTRESRWVVPEQ